VSKAFTKEDAEGAPEAPAPYPSRASLPAGTLNYVTPTGKAALEDEQRRLVAAVAALAAQSPSAERTTALARAAHERAALEERLTSARVVEPTSQPQDEIRFGAVVTVRDESGRVRRYQIVGVDEADAPSGKIAFLSPLARALLGRTVGEVATVRTPRGEEAWEIVSLSYGAPS